MCCGCCSDETWVVFGLSILGGVLWIDIFYSGRSETAAVVVLCGSN